MGIRVAQLRNSLIWLAAYTAYLVYDAGLPVWAGMLAAPVVVAR
jgi:hypothetical protein